MKIYYVDSNGEIIRAIFDRDDYSTTIKIGYPYGVLGIDEIDPDNKGICLDIANMAGRQDINGNGKYYVSSGELYVRDGWEEYVDV